MLLVIDRSGSMMSIRDDMVGGLNAMLTQQKEKFSWDFVFLGANQDAVLAGATMGFDAGSSMTYAAGKEGVDSMASSVGRYVSDVRGKEKRMFLMEERMGAVQETAEPTADGTPATDADGASAA